VSTVARILTTHVGALQRPPGAEAALLGEAGEEELADAVAEVVRRQVEAGIDVVDDGEFGKSIWQWYVTERLGGIERREHEAPPLRGRDHIRFADFYAYANETPDVLFHGTDRAFWASIATRPVCVGPITYQPGPLERDIANLQAALRGAGAVDAFMPAVAPASVEVDMGNEHYATQDELLWALAEAMKEEYRAIVEAGFQLQVDDAWIPALWDHEPELDLETYRRFCLSRIEALNHALEGLPEDRVRYHLCWGSWHGPHATDIPLAEIVDLMLQVNAGVYSVEAANVRHEHEYHLWEDVELPAGKKLAPGVVTHSTNLIEHPELVAERIVRFAERVGRENVIASTDCGMGSRIHPQLGWAKLEALSEGARLASGRLWSKEQAATGTLRGEAR
jgi:5-methyltetrahydropteroyltriglutamate--homocysteine methyltransferase